MEQFNLDKWLENPSRKVVIRDGREIQIIEANCSKDGIPMVVLNNGENIRWIATDELRNNEIYKDLFFADEEDDEFMLNSFLHKLEVCDLLSNKEITWIKNKLKSIKQWKPSEKQMDELEYVTRWNSYPHLTSLYQDLKNLI